MQDIHRYVTHVLTGFVSTWHNLESSEKSEPQLRKCFYEIQLWGIFSISDLWERVQPIVGGATPGLLILNSIRKQAKQALRSKSVKQQPSMASVSAPAFRCLPCLSSCLTSFSDEQQCGSISWINPFLPSLLLGHDALCRNRNLD